MSLNLFSHLILNHIVTYYMSFIDATDIALNAQSSIKKTNKLSNYKFIAGPVHFIDREHWCLIFFNMSTFTFYYFDSLFSNDTNLYSERVFINMIKFCSKYSDLKNIKWTNGSLNNYITQNDSYSCGLFVCYFFESLL